jgi:hypothetical protein
MRRQAIWVMALAAAGAVGCVPSLFVQPEAQSATARSIPARPPVTPDEIGDGNAAAIINALEDELDRAGGERLAAPPSKSGR